MAKKTTKGVVFDTRPSQAVQDFSVKLTDDMIGLLKRTFYVMSEEIGAKESIDVMLSVLALAGVSTAQGAGADRGVFVKYAALAEEAVKGHDERRALSRRG